MRRRDALALALVLSLVEGWAAAQPIEAADAQPRGASVHCYSVWRYPHPQRCGFRAPRPRPIVARSAAPVLRVEPSPGRFDLPMIDPDPATTALRELLQ